MQHGTMYNYMCKTSLAVLNAEIWVCAQVYNFHINVLEKRFLLFKTVNLIKEIK